MFFKLSGTHLSTRPATMSLHLGRPSSGSTWIAQTFQRFSSNFGSQTAAQGLFFLETWFNCVVLFCPSGVDRTVLFLGQKKCNAGGNLAWVSATGAAGVLLVWPSPNLTCRKHSMLLTYKYPILKVVCATIHKHSSLSTQSILVFILSTDGTWNTPIRIRLKYWKKLISEQNRNIEWDMLLNSANSVVPGIQYQTENSKK